MRNVLVALFSASVALGQIATWKQNPATGRWYGVGQAATSWSVGEALANNLGGHLATIRDAPEQAWIESAFAAELGTEGLWIGFNDIAVEGQWVWSSGEPVTFTNWAPGEPNNGPTFEQDWGRLWGNGGYPWLRDDLGPHASGAYPRALVELPAASPPPPLQWVLNPANGHYYALTPQLNWTDSEALAQQYGGHLATVRNASENAWLATTFFNGSECHWIGLNDQQVEGTFEWYSGEPVGYTNWFTNEPTNGMGVEDWVHLGLPWVGPTAYSGWNDSPNSATSYGWVCRGIIEVVGGPPATHTPFGSGCVGPMNGVPVLDGVIGAAPRLGSDATVMVDNLPLAVTVPIFVYGLSNTQDPGPPAYNLPLDLAPLGWPGCQQLVSDDVYFLTITNTGYAEHSISIPMNAAFVGFEYHVQVFVLYSPVGVAVSNGVTATVGW